MIIGPDSPWDWNSGSHIKTIMVNDGKCMYLVLLHGVSGIGPSKEGISLGMN